MIKDILLVRHGEAYNTAPLDGAREVRDRANPPLTPLGERQAGELTPLLVEFAPDLALVSPFLRAVQTLWPSVREGALSGLDTDVDHRFGELFADPVFAGFRGLDLPEYSARFGARFRVPAAYSGTERFPVFPESAASVRGRVRALWLSLQGRGRERVVFVGHGASLGALLTMLVPSLPESTGHVNCGATHLRREGTGWHAVYVNRKDHLSVSGAEAALE